MRKIYVDAENKCHITNDGTMVEVKTDFFDGKCDAFIEGFLCKIAEDGTPIYPWQPYSELEAAQSEHERQQLADYKAACERMGIKV